MTEIPQQTWSSVVAGRPSGRPRHEWFLQLFTKVRPGEGRSVALFFSYAFVLLVSYYILRTLREPLLLVSGSPASKTYASATAALALLFLVPLYGVVFRRTSKGQLVRWVTAFFLGTLGALYLAGRSGLDIGFLYYVWAGVFGVTIVAQFWAHASDCFSVESGHRLFPVIMAGATLGGLAGPALFRALHGAFEPLQLMLVAMVLLALTLPLVEWTRNTVPVGSRGPATEIEKPSASRPLGGFSLILHDRYLLLLALLVLLLNCVNTMGEYLLSEQVVRYADEQIASQPWLDKGKIIGEFYANFFLVMNALTVVTQVFLVSRLFRWIGVHGALLVLPVVALIGYGLVAFLPIFSIVRVVKILENSGNYSVTNTARQALYLPLPAAGKYEGKIATDAFFWRFGDLFPAAIVFIGANWLDFEFRHFALVNVGLSLAWLAVAVQLAQRRSEPTTDGRRFPLARVLLVDYRRYLPFPPRGWLARGAAGWLALVLGIVAVTRSAPAQAEVGAAADAVRHALFERQEPLSMDMLLDLEALCRDPGRKDCADSPATLVYHDEAGREQRVAVALRARGRNRAETVQCSLPALFVFFTGDTHGTLFEGEEMLPLTTHCKRTVAYEQYTLKEYLAYRIYNLLTSKSLRVRLVRVTYRDTLDRVEPLERYAFFTEHFNSLARRHDATVRPEKYFDPLEADSLQIATHDLFQYAIGNTDWSVAYGHNVVLIENESGPVTAVPYDFDFSGLVNADYAGVPPKLPIRNVRQRLFRGVCRADTDWGAAFAHFEARRGAVLALADEITDLQASNRGDVTHYLGGAFDTFFSPQRRDRQIVAACRRADGD